MKPTAKQIRDAKAKTRQALQEYERNPTKDNRRKMAAAAFTMLCMIKK